jgi:K+-transporting ATPase ATPase C chain
MQNLWVAVRMTFALTILLGIIYPLTVFVLGQALFPWQANGSLIVRHGKVVGSALIGQSFSRPDYFHSRPSAAGNSGYDAANSGGSNLGPTNRKLIDQVKARLAKILKENRGIATDEVPVDLVTSSASGLDPDISPASALLQVARVAKARGLPESTVRALIAVNTHGRWLGLFGEPAVNVVELNLALDEASGNRALTSK